MQKRIFTTLFLVGLVVLMLTLTLTPFATAEWKDNAFTNNTSGNLYVAFSTFRPAKAPIPEGWRTVGWYRIQPGKSHTFQAWADNPIYYLIWDDPTQGYLTPDNAKTFAHWEHVAAFVTVSEDEPNAPVAAANLLYSNRPKASLISSDFFKSANGGSVTVTAAKKVVAPLAEGDVAEGDETVGKGDPPPTGGITDEPPEPTEPAPPTLTISGTLNIKEGERTTITATVLSADGKGLPGLRLRFSEDSNHISLSALGTAWTDDSGKRSVRVTGSSPGGAVLSVGVDEYPGLTQQVAITVAEAPPGSLTIDSFSTSINEGDSRTIRVTVKSEAGKALSGKTVRFQESSSAISFSSSSGTTNSSGQVSTTLRTSNVSSRSSATFYVKVDGYSGLDTSRSVTINQVASSLSVSGVSTSVYSGQSMTVKARVLSKGGYGMSGVTVTFSESSSYLRFSYSSRTTDSSGYASSSLRTGGKTSGSKITIRASGVSSPKSYTIRVNPRSRTTDRYFSDEGKRIGAFTTNYWQRRNKTVYFPGNVTSWKWRSKNSNATVTSTVKSGSTGVKVNYNILAKTTPLAWIRVWVDGTYEEVASNPGAPSLRPEVDQLSAVWQDLSQMPSETALLPNYPNPFNPETWIPYHLAEAASVTLHIYAADGTLVRTLVLGYQPAGMYENKSRAAYWDGRNSIGERVASGLYFYTFTAGDFAATKKMLIMK